MSKYKVLFFSTHNSCRSQISEALSRIFAADVIEPVSAGLEPFGEINPNASRVMRELYGIDINEAHNPKSFCDVPDADVVIYFSHDVTYPNIRCKYSEVWDIGDMADKPVNFFRKLTGELEVKVIDLKKRLENGLIS